MYILLLLAAHASIAPDRRGIQSHSVCASACGLVATELECMLAVPVGSDCDALWVKGDELLWQRTRPEGDQWYPLTIIDATKRVSVSHELCPLMSKLSCSMHGVCPNVSWNKSNILTGIKHEFRTEKGNGHSDVLCSYLPIYNMPIERKIGYVDPCPELCALDGLETCTHTRRVKGICLNLIWEFMANVKTKLVSQNVLGDVDVTVREAYEILRVDSCQDLCKNTLDCNSSTCRPTDHTCSDLFFKERRQNKLMSCFGQGCGAAKVLCELEGDIPGGIMAIYANIKSAKVLNQLGLILGLLIITW